MEQLATEICRQLREARRSKGLTQAELAQRVACQQSAISMMESGRTTALARETLVRIAAELGDDAANHGGDAKRAHRAGSWAWEKGAAADWVAKLKNAVSRFSVPARLRSSAGVPCARTRPSLMKSSSSQRSASSMTWLETRSVAPSAASL